MRKLKVAIVGCGRISVSYLSAFQKLSDRVNVVYAVDKEVDKARLFSKNFLGCKVESDMNTILDKDIDVIHICLPHYLHKEAAIRAMCAKKNVLVEKPVAMTLQQADEMIKVELETKVKAGVIFQTRYVKGIEIIKELIRSGKLGKITGAKSTLTWSRQADYYAGSDWKGTWDGEGGGVLIDQAIHSIDRVRYLIGEEVLWVHGNVDNNCHHFVNVEDTAAAVIGFRGGCIYNLYATNVYKDDSPIEIELLGEKGRAKMIQDMGYIEIDGKCTEIRNTYEDVIVGPGYWGSAHDMQLQQFYDAVCNDTPVEVSLMEGRKTLELVKGIYESSRKREKIVFPFEDRTIHFLNQ